MDWLHGLIDVYTLMSAKIYSSIIYSVEMNRHSFYVLCLTIFILAILNYLCSTCMVHFVQLCLLAVENSICDVSCLSVSVLYALFVRVLHVTKSILYIHSS
jgi:hypothetical protein